MYNKYLIEIKGVEIVFGGIAGAGTQVEFAGQLVAVEPSPFQTTGTISIVDVVLRHIDDAPCCRR